jgi:Predicted xylanase/chitin deacetylase
MNRKKGLAILLSTILLLAGCSKRGEDAGSGPPPDEQPEELLGEENPTEAQDPPPSSAASSPADTGSSGAENARSTAATAMSADYAAIGALDGTKQGWGPGVNTDNNNRPIGATDFQTKYGDYSAWYIAPNVNTVYLTFDEGYENGYTAQILDTLKEKEVKAVFFLTLPYAKSQPELVQRMVEEGHILGNHSSKHLSFPDMPLEEAAADILALHAYVKANFGYEMTLFRPPMGEFSVQTLALAESLGYQSVFWSFAYRDWEVDNQPLTLEALNNCVSRCHPGAIYLLHAVSQTNAEILGDFIDQVRAKGYTFSKFYL